MKYDKLQIVGLPKAQKRNKMGMKTLLLPLLACVMSVSVSCSRPSLEPTESEQNLMGQITRILEVRKQLADSFWPEFDRVELSAPMVFYEDSVCYVVNPKEKFLKDIPCERIRAKGFDFYKTARLDESTFRMDTHVDLYSDSTYTGRDAYVMCSTLGESQRMFSDIEDETQWIPMVIHELAHGCQDAHPEHYKARQEAEYPVFELDLLTYPSQYPWLADMLAAENGYLLSAISGDDRDEVKASVNSFLESRRIRKEKMLTVFGDSLVREEESFETAESMARFMEVQSTLMLGKGGQDAIVDAPFYSRNVTQAYFFVTGYNLVRLFVKLGIDLDLPYRTTEHQPLEAFLITWLQVETN